MASPKIGKSKEGKSVKQMSTSQLESFIQRGGKDKHKAQAELVRRGK